jgi:ABC-type nitrate/sulfonate/bicarbonate transport system substrate-binding protein
MATADELREEWERLSAGSENLTGPQLDDWLARAEDFALRMEAAGFPYGADDIWWTIQEIRDTLPNS